MENINEITVKLSCDLPEFFEFIKKENYKEILKFTLNDNYMIPNDLDIENLTIREILSKAILVREIIEFCPAAVIHKLTFKIKKFDENGNILSQEAISCKVQDMEKTEKFLNAIGYKKIMNIFETNTVVKKDDFQFAIKDIRDGDNLIECEIAVNNCLSIDELKNRFIERKIPICTDNFFVKKAEIELEKVLKNKV